MTTIFTRRHARRMNAARRARNARARVAAAFRELANGLTERSAYSATVAFYRSGREWAKTLG